jgi:hypothetical protein
MKGEFKMKAEERKTFIDYLKNNKENLAIFFKKTIKDIEELISLLEGELINKNIRAFYFTKCMTDINGGRAGEQLECWYESLDKALATPLPNGCVSGCIFAEEGTYYFNKQNGWEFYKEKI